MTTGIAPPADTRSPERPAPDLLRHAVVARPKDQCWASLSALPNEDFVLIAYPFDGRLPINGGLLAQPVALFIDKTWSLAECLGAIKALSSLGLSYRVHWVGEVSEAGCLATTLSGTVVVDPTLSASTLAETLRSSLNEEAGHPVELLNTRSVVSPSLLEICQAISSTLDLQPLLERILDLSTQELNAQQGSLLLIDAQSEELKMVATKGMPREIVERGYIPRKGSISEWVIEHAEPLILNDAVVDDKRFCSIAQGRPIKSSLCVPLQAKGKVIGTLNLVRTEGHHSFIERDLQTLMIMASQAAVAIENARLHDSLLKATRLATLGQTISGISHCIKNILTGIKGGLAIAELARNEKDWALFDRGWDMLKRNVNRISLLVLDMLDFSKKREPVRQPTNLNELVDEAFEMVMHQAEENHITLEKDVPQNIPEVPLDSDQILRCLLNVINNALDATDQGGSVCVRAVYLTPRETAYRMFVNDGHYDCLILEVSDTGHGIPPHLVKQIFNPFYSTKGSKGTGLGMPVTQKIIEEHGGRIEIDSQPGHGTTVRFILPVIDQQ